MKTNTFLCYVCTVTRRNKHNNHQDFFFFSIWRILCLFSWSLAWAEEGLSSVMGLTVSVEDKSWDSGTFSFLGEVMNRHDLFFFFWFLKKKFAFSLLWFFIGQHGASILPALNEEEHVWRMMPASEVPRKNNWSHDWPQHPGVPLSNDNPWPQWFHRNAHLVNFEVSWYRHPHLDQAQRVCQFSFFFWALQAGTMMKGQEA